jgi:hypothetical protein
MHPLEIMLNVMALAFGVAVLAFLAVLVAAFAFFGVLIAGLVVLLISYTVELEDGSAIGESVANPSVTQFGLYLQ